jgi:hypothetical protein
MEACLTEVADPGEQDRSSRRAGADLPWRASGSAMIWALVGGLVKVAIAQMRVGREVARNRETICSLLRRTAPGDWVVFPEGALTAYFPGEPDYLADTGRAEVEVALERLRAVVARRGPLSPRYGPLRRGRVAQLCGAPITRRRGPLLRQERPKPARLEALRCR